MSESSQQTWQITKGLTGAEAKYRAKQEVLQPAVKCHIAITHRACTRMNARFVNNVDLPQHTHRMLSRAANKWKRAALHRARQTRELAIARARKNTSMIYKPPSS